MNPKPAAGIGAVVGMFLSPAAWVALLALTAGRAAVDAINGLTTTPIPLDLRAGVVDLAKVVDGQRDGGCSDVLVQA